MKFTLFHLMPYADLDLDGAAAYPTAWVHTPNTFYDPKRGARLYNRYLDELELGEALGFDGIAVNEHHSTAYGMMPSPIVMASALARRTRTAKIAILGSAIPLRDHPLTLAEEHSMIDNITEGRLITGFVRGIGAEYHAWGTNPAFSHERFHEAHDLIIAAWTRPGPFRWSSKHYHFEYVNPWPRPYQQPHPPIWVPSQGSGETIEWAAHPDRKYTYLQTFSPLKSVRRYLEQYRETAARHGYAAADDKLGWAVPIYVAESDEVARREAKLHFENFRNKFLQDADRDAAAARATPRSSRCGASPGPRRRSPATSRWRSRSRWACSSAARPPPCASRSRPPGRTCASGTCWRCCSSARCRPT